MALLLLTSLLSGLATCSVLLSGSPIPPRQDPWYTAPEGYELASPGDVLRIRNAPGNLTTVFNGSSAAYNILFRSTDSNSQPSWAITTIFVPAKSNGSALLSYQIPYNSPDADASPSYALYTYGGLVESDIEAALARGWYVNVPDHEGPRASFTCGVQEGHATLDSVPAVLNQFKGWSLANTPRVALWGYSGGSIASEFAAEVQVQYAPELQIDGAALGGIVPNISSALHNLPGTIFAGLIPAGLVGFSTQHPAVEDYLLSQLNSSGPFNASTFLSVKNMSIAEAFTAFANQSMYNFFKNGKAFFDPPVLQQAFARDGIQGYHGVPQMPLYIYKAIHDEIAFVEDADALVARYCQVDANILYERNSIGGHLAEETNGDVSAIEWLSGVLSGTYNHTGCTIRNVAINVTDSPV